MQQNTPMSVKQALAGPPTIFLVPRWLERALCLLVLALKGLHFWKFRGVLIGYDCGDHLLRYQQTDWWMPEPALRGSFYAYHPPLGFLVPNLLARLGLSGHLAMQLFTVLCGTAAFLLLRAVLARLQLLANGLAVAFLYLWAGFPILVNCDVSLNLDVIILAFGCLVLLCSVRLWGPNPELASGWRVMWKCLLVLALAGMMMTKFSGLLFFVLPAVVIVVFGEWKWPILRPLLASTVLVLLAGALVLPYYYQRYYLPEKTWLPRNEDFWIPADIEAAKVVRDRDRLGFVLQLLTPAFLQPKRAIETRAADHLRYSDVWRDLWIRDDVLYYQPGEKFPHGMPVIKIGIAYSLLMSALGLGGTVLWCRAPKTHPLDRLGLVLLLQGAIFVLAHLVYCYRDATAIYSTAKGIYILPATPFVAFLAVQWLRQKISAPHWLARLQKYAVQAGVGLLPAWLLLNYLWPVY